MTIEQVRKYWDTEPCGTGRATSAVNSMQYFDEIEDYRYRVEPCIHSFAQFSRWNGKKVLEVGCGCGTDLLQFIRSGADACAIDISPNSVNLTRQRMLLYGFRVNVAEASAEDIPLPSDYFDMVYSWGVLHHTPNPKAAINEIHRVLKPSGNIKIMLYNRYSWLGLKLYIRYGLFKTMARTFAEHMESPGTKAYTVREIRQLLSQFSNVNIQPILTSYDYAKVIRKAFPFSWLVRLLGDKYGSFILIDGNK